MSDPTEPARSLLSEALLHLSAHGVDVIVDWDAAGRRLYMDGKATTEGEIVSRAVALGMLKSETRLR